MRIEMGIGVASLVLLAACSGSSSQSATESDSVSSDLTSSLSSVDDPSELRMNGTTLFWTTAAGLYSRAKSHGTRKRLVSAHVGRFDFPGHGYVVDDTTAYVIANNKLVKVNASGGGRVNYTFSLNAQEIATDGTDLFVATDDTIYKVPKDFSAAPTQVVANPCPRQGGQQVLGVSSLTADATRLYFRTCGVSLVSYPVAGGSQATVFDQPVSFDGYQVHDGTVYVLFYKGSGSGNDNTFASTSPTGGVVTEIASTRDDHFVVDGTRTVFYSGASIDERQPDGSVKNLGTYDHDDGFESSGSVNGVLLDGASYWFAIGDTRPHGYVDPVKNSGEIDLGSFDE